MQVAVSAAGPSLEPLVDPGFGRCVCCMMAETDDMSFEAVSNANDMLGGGAGIQTSQLVLHVRSTFWIEPEPASSKAEPEPDLNRSQAETQ